MKFPILAQEKCGLVPSKVFLSKGEKRQVVFWTDQDYSQQVTTLPPISPPEDQDPFLEFVNSNKQNNEDLPETEDEIPTSTIKITVPEEIPEIPTTAGTTVDDGLKPTTPQEDDTTMDITTEVPREDTTTTESVEITTVEEQPQEEPQGTQVTKDEEEAGNIGMTTEIAEEFTETTKLPEMTTVSVVEVESTTLATEELTTETEQTEDTMFMVAETTTVLQVSEMFEEETTTRKEDTDEGESGSGVEDTINSKIVFPDVTLDYMFEETLGNTDDKIIAKEKEMMDSRIVFESPALEPLTEDDAEASGSDEYQTLAEAFDNEVIYDDDIGSYDMSNSTDYSEEADEDKILVVTSMPLTESSPEESNNSEDVLVVTGAPAQVKTWDELELIEDNDTFPTINEDYIEETTVINHDDVMANTVPMDTTMTTMSANEIMMTTETMTSEETSEEDVTTGKSTTILLETTASTMEENTASQGMTSGDISEAVTTTDIPTTASKDVTNGDITEDVTTTHLPETKILELEETTTSMGESDREGADTTIRQDTTTVAQMTSMETTTLDQKEITKSATMETTTMAQMETTTMASKETTTMASMETTTMAAMETTASMETKTMASTDTTSMASTAMETTTYSEEIQDDDSYDYSGDDQIAGDSVTRKIFQETTTGSPQRQSSEAAADLFPIAAVESETEKIFEEVTMLPVVSSSTYFPIAPIVSDTKETIFDETTTGSPTKTDLVPEVEAVEAEEDEEDTEDAFDYAAAAGSLETQAVFAETTTGAGFDTKYFKLNEETTAGPFTPAFTTASIKNKTDQVEVEVEASDSSKIFFPDDIESMVAKLASEIEKETTVGAVETTTALAPEDLTRDLANKTDSPIVEVEAGNVNGPLALDNVMYYDDPETDDDTEDQLIATLEQNVDSSENEILDDDLYDTNGSGTTVINGFIINKKSVIALDNNGLETVRTSGILDINLDESIGTEDFQSVEITTEMPEEPITILDELIANENETISAKNNEYEYSDEMFNNNATEEYQEDIVVSEDTEEIIEETPAESEEEKPSATFPVTELLNGIYKLIQGYIPTQAEKQSDEKPVITQNVEKKVVPLPPAPPQLVFFDSPEAQPLPNVHNAPRAPALEIPNREGEVLVETDGLVPSPFKQLSAPDLSGLVPAEEREDNVQYIFASEVKKSPPITLSPFNSAALIVEEPPKALFDENVPSDEEYKDEEDSSFSNFIQKPFEAFLPSFLTNKKPKPTKVQVAGSLPITVSDKNGQGLSTGRRPPVSGPADTRFPILGSLFSRNSPQPPQARRPLRPDVPAQPSLPNAFMPVGPNRQRSSPVSIPLPGTVQVEQDLPTTNRVARDVRLDILRLVVMM